MPLNVSADDDVGSVDAVSVAVAHQAGGDRVTVGLVMDQNAAEVVASLRVEHLEDGMEFAVTLDRVRQAHPCLMPNPKAATLASMRRRVAFVLATLAVLAVLGSIGLAFRAVANPRPPQQPGNLERDNNYSIASDQVCVHSLKYSWDPVGSALDRDLPNILVLIVASLVLALVAVRLFRGSHSNTPSPMMAQGP
jgi:hypothetical protein